MKKFTVFCGFALAAANMACTAPGYAAGGAPSIEEQQRQILFESMLYNGDAGPNLQDKIPEPAATAAPAQHAQAVRTPPPARPTQAPRQRIQKARTDYTAPVPSPEVRLASSSQQQPAARIQHPSPTAGKGELFARAKAGDPNAEYQIGMLYTQDRTGPNSSAAAEQTYYWFTQAASKGHPRAQYNLGVMHAQGDGIVQNLVEAYIWFNLAAAQHMDGAPEARDMVARSLTPDALMKAQERSSLYHQKILQNIASMQKNGPTAFVPVQ